MAIRVTMPMLGLTMEEGTVAEWLKHEGDAVQKDEPLLTVEMDKGTQEVPSPAAGVLRRIVVQPGTTVPVKTLIAEIGEPGEVWPPAPSDAGPAAGEPQAAGVPGGPQGSASAPGSAVPESLTSAVSAASEPPTAGGPGDLPARPPSGAQVAAVSVPPAADEARPAPTAGPGGAGAAAPASAGRAEVPGGAGAAAPVGAGRAGVTGGAGAAAPTGPGRAGVPGGEGAGAHGARLFASPRARMRARALGVALQALGAGSGPQGRIVEADVLAAGAAEARVVATPLARRLAQEHGVDIAQVQGTGPGGRITQDDVLLAADAAASAGRQLEVALAQPGAGGGLPVTDAADGAGAAAGGQRRPQPAPGEVRPLTRVRRITADRMAASAHTSASVTLFLEADFSEAVRFREQLQPEFARLGVAKLPWDALIAKAAALALLEHPSVAAQWVDGQGLRQPEAVHVGVAVALAPEGLVVPVLQQAAERSLRQLAADLLVLVDKARAGRLSPSEMHGGAFTITNLGAYRVDGFTPIVNPPEAAILGVGRIAPKPTVIDGKVDVRTLCTLSLSFDHRVVDGATAAAFLARLAQLLERPYNLLGI